MSAAVAGGARVEARSVSRRFAARGADFVTAVEHVSLAFEPGEFVGLAGRSGSGKTTLLCMLGGLDHPSSGAILHDGADLAALSRAHRIRASRSIGFVFQNAAVLRRLPVWENVSHGLVPLGVPAVERREMALVALGRVELESLARRRPAELSAGERQRVALARALVQEPRLLLADEPTSNLDRESAAIVSDVLSALHAGGCTVLVASHDESLLTAADRVLAMESGRLRDA